MHLIHVVRQESHHPLPLATQVLRVLLDAIVSKSAYYRWQQEIVVTYNHACTLRCDVRGKEDGILAYPSKPCLKSAMLPTITRRKKCVKSFSEAF
jgi:hypothetical protein